MLAFRQIDLLVAQRFEGPDQRRPRLPRVDDVVDEVEAMVLGQREDVDVLLAILAAAFLEEGGVGVRGLGLLQVT